MLMFSKNKTPFHSPSYIIANLPNDAKTVLLLYNKRTIYQQEAKVTTEPFPGGVTHPKPSRNGTGVATEIQQALLKNALKCLHYCEKPTDVL